MADSFVLNLTCNWPINFECPRVHMYPDIFEFATFSFRIQIDFARLHISDKYPDSLWYTGLLWEYWQQSMRRGCHIQGKELGSILLRHRIKKFSDLASTRFRIHSVFKNVHSGERIKKVTDFLSNNYR